MYVKDLVTFTDLNVMPVFVSFFNYYVSLFVLNLEDCPFLPYVFYSLILMYCNINSFPSLASHFSPQDLFHLPVFLFFVLAVWYAVIFYYALSF